MDKNYYDLIKKMAGFAKKTRIIILGRENIIKNQDKLQFVLMAEDLSENGKKLLRNKIKILPVIAWGTSLNYQTLFEIEHTKIIGFKKHPISKHLLEELKDRSVNG